MTTVLIAPIAEDAGLACQMADAAAEHIAGRGLAGYLEQLDTALR